MWSPCPEEACYPKCQGSAHSLPGSTCSHTTEGFSSVMSPLTCWKPRVCTARPPGPQLGHLGSKEETEELEFVGISSLNVAPLFGPVWVDRAKGTILGMVASVVLHTCFKILLCSCAHKWACCLKGWVSIGEFHPFHSISFQAF